ncbi:MAG TPA: hypothetical protein VLA02_09105, partial [Reyranella sp.]|nr:hypothetical protein [Reyranella sp.]
WMSQMRGMASEFRGHVDEMVRQSELDEVKKQLEGAPGLDLQALDPTKQIKEHIQEGMAECEKAFNEAKSTFDNPLVEPESAPQIAAEPAPQIAAEPAPQIGAEPAPQIGAEPTSQTAAETASAVTAEARPPAHEEKPAKAAAE